LKNQTFYVPVGSIMPFAGASSEVPAAGWLLCSGLSGTAVTLATYPDLFNVLTAYGTVYPHGGSGSTTYTPDLRGRTIIGVGAGAEITGVLGTLQGVKEVTLTGAQSGTSAHSHPQGTTSSGDWNAVYNHYSPGSGSSAYPVSTSEGGGRTIQGAGGGHTHTYTVPTATAANASAAHTNIQPSIPLNYIIKV